MTDPTIREIIERAIARVTDSRAPDAVLADLAANEIYLGRYTEPVYNDDPRLGGRILLKPASFVPLNADADLAAQGYAVVGVEEREAARFAVDELEAIAKSDVAKQWWSPHRKEVVERYIAALHRLAGSEARGG